MVCDNWCVQTRLVQGALFLSFFFAVDIQVFCPGLAHHLLKNKEIGMILPINDFKGFTHYDNFLFYFCMFSFSVIMLYRIIAIIQQLRQKKVNDKMIIQPFCFSSGLWVHSFIELSYDGDKE